MLWVLAFHIIFVVTWFAGLFYLPRLFVYHAQTAATDIVSIERLKVMERRLFYGIMVPSAILVLITGYWLLEAYALAAYNHTYWLHIKLVLVLLLYIYFGICWKYMNDFKYNRNRHSHIFFRWFNEVPSIILIAVVILAVVKPF
jgi:putative membrane protein